MRQDDVTADTYLALRCAGVTLLVEVTGGRLPAVVHWGAELPDLDAAQAAALAAAAVPVIGPNCVDEPVRVAVLPEAAAGWTGRPGLRGSFAGRGWSPSFRVRQVLLDGVPVSGLVAAGAASAEFLATDDAAALDLAVVLELLPSGLVRGRATVTNRTDDVYTLDGLALVLPVPADADELLDFSGRHALERVPQRSPFGVGTHLRENRRGRTGADSAYVLHAGTPAFGFAEGRVHAVHVAFSGNHVHLAERAATGERLLGGGELLLPGEVRLGRGEGYRSPWLYGSFGHGLDEVAHRFHRHLRARVPRVGADRPVTLNVWEAVYFDQDLEKLLQLAERAAEIGVERYVLDDGWFSSRRDDRSGLGDWVVSADAWPDGLHPLVKRVRALGMQFGLWFEPEMVNPDSEVARAHPEWIMSARTAWPVESRWQQVLDLTIPEAYRHVRDQVLAVLGEYDVDYVKWDHNRDLIEAGSQPDGGRPAVHAQTEAFYRLLDEIRAARPGMEIESCSSGGGRVDLAVLERTDRIWVSDSIDPHDRQHLLRWTAQLVPPEYLGSHIASGRSHMTGRSHDLSFRAATAIFGHLGIEWDLTAASDAELAELRAWLAFWTAHRELLLTSDVVRMDGPGDGVLVHGVVAPDRSRALFAQVTTDSPYPSPPARLRLRGLDPARTYRLRPVIVGAVAPSGLRAPAWWGALQEPAPGASWAEFAGTALVGAALERVGVASPLLHPDQAVLYLVDGVGR